MEPSLGGVIPTMAQMPSLSDWGEISTHVEFFRRRSNLSDSFDIREARPAYELHDDFLEEGEYLFLWKLGKTGRFVITLPGPANVHLPLLVRRVTLRIGGGDAQQLEFVQGSDFRLRTVIKAYLDAARIDCPRLQRPCCSWGEIDEKYVPMNILIEVAAGRDSAVVHEFISTVFCKVVANRITPNLYAMQSVWLKWQKAPQSTREVLRGTWNAVIAALKSRCCCG